LFHRGEAEMDNEISRGNLARDNKR
jgi:hypothetical protein